MMMKKKMKAQKLKKKKAPKMITSLSRRSPKQSNNNEQHLKMKTCSKEVKTILLKFTNWNIPHVGEEIV